jgi:hypothetical protein
MSDDLPEDEHRGEEETEPREDLEGDEERHGDARETKNPDNHRDEEPRD